MRSTSNEKYEKSWRIMEKYESDGKWWEIMEIHENLWKLWNIMKNHEKSWKINNYGESWKIMKNHEKSWKSWKIMKIMKNMKNHEKSWIFYDFAWFPKNSEIKCQCSCSSPSDSDWANRSVYFTLRFFCRVFQSASRRLRLCKSERKFYAPLFRTLAAIVRSEFRKFQPVRIWKCHCCTRKLLQRISCAKDEKFCQRRWSKIVATLVLATKQATHTHSVSLAT